MEINIRITNKTAYAISTALLIIMLAVLANAGRPTDKAGHRADEIWVDINGEEMTLEEALQTKLDETFKSSLKNESIGSDHDSETVEEKKITPPEGYNTQECAILVSPEDMHAGRKKSNVFADTGSWKNNHYAGSQAVYTEDGNKWSIKCRYGFSYKDNAHKKTDGEYNLQWRAGSCNYLIICKPAKITQNNHDSGSIDESSDEGSASGSGGGNSNQEKTHNIR